MVVKTIIYGLKNSICESDILIEPRTEIIDKIRTDKLFVGQLVSKFLSNKSEELVVYRNIDDFYTKKHSEFVRKKVFTTSLSSLIESKKLQSFNLILNLNVDNKAVILDDLKDYAHMITSITLSENWK